VKLIKLSQLAKDLNVNYLTVFRWHKKKKINTIQTDSSSLFINQDEYNRILNIKPVQELLQEKVVIYCRVGSTTNKANLITQKERLISYCNAKGYSVYKVIEEFGSGINDSRCKLIKLLEELDFTKIVVEHKDRLTRVGFNYLNLFCKSHNREIEVVNNVDTDKEDLIQDFVSIIASYCARIYGKRRSKRKTETIIRNLQND
jgi:predicted site-specific integrase-resolvase